MSLVLQVSNLMDQLNNIIANIKPHPRLPLLVLCDDAPSLTAIGKLLLAIYHHGLLSP